MTSPQSLNPSKPLLPCPFCKLEPETREQLIQNGKKWVRCIIHVDWLEYDVWQSRTPIPDDLKKQEEEKIRKAAKEIVERMLYDEDYIVATIMEYLYE